MKHRSRLLRVSVCLVVLIGMAIPSTVSAQNSGKLSNQYIPADAIVAGFAFPQEILASPEWAMAPIEVIQAAGKQYVGVDPTHITSVKVIVGMPGPAGPQGGAVVEFSQDYLFENLNPEMLQMFQPSDQGGKTVYESRQQPVVRVHQVNPRTLLIGTGGYLPKMLAASDGDSGQVPDLVARINRRKGVTLIAGMEQIRPMVTGMLQQVGPQIPPPLQGLTQVGELTDAIFVSMDYAPMSGSLRVSAIGRDEASAAQLETTLNDTIDFARMMATAEIKKNMEGGDPVGDAMLQYIDRMGNDLSAMVRPQRNGTLVNVSMDGNVGTTGILVGLLLPAVQAAREASRRMTASNGLKQIGLAMHNHHSAYKTLPDRAITDANGKPLLSWRVKILPFIEEQQLYEQFHLDEPWDSPHNIKLLDQMPRAYVDPSVPVAPGHTVFQVPVGPGLMFEDAGGRKFRDVLDGLSNTIMAVETSRDAAVPWTRPDDWEVDMLNPLSNTGDSHPGGFHVLMSDGAVIFITKSIDLDLFKALLTRAGNEVIEERLNQ